jgi:hypothetical protein
VVADAKQAMREKLKTRDGRELYALRRQTVERVFGNIKSNKGLNRFSLSALAGAKSEFWLACMTHNLMIVVRKAALARLSASRTALIFGWTAIRAGIFSGWLVLQGGSALQMPSSYVVLQRLACSRNGECQ